MARQQEVGFKVDLQVLDWATVVQRRGKLELWDLFTTGITFGPDPALTSNLQCDWPGWWCHEEKERLLAELIRESDPRKRRALIERIQAVFCEDVGQPVPALLERVAAALRVSGGRSLPEATFLR